jgi:hypothetical protein
MLWQCISMLWLRPSAPGDPLHKMFWASPFNYRVYLSLSPNSLFSSTASIHLLLGLPLPLCPAPCHVVQSMVILLAVPDLDTCPKYLGLLSCAFCAMSSVMRSLALMLEFRIMFPPWEKSENKWVIYFLALYAMHSFYCAKWLHLSNFFLIFLPIMLFVHFVFIFKFFSSTKE